MTISLVENKLFIGELNASNLLLSTNYVWTSEELYLERNQISTSGLTEIFLLAELSSPLFNLPFDISADLKLELINITDALLSYIPKFSSLSDVEFAKFFFMKSEIKKINRKLNTVY